MQGLVAVQSIVSAHTSGGGGGVQFAQRRRLRERAQEEEEIAMVLTVLAQIGVFA